MMRWSTRSAYCTYLKFSRSGKMEHSVVEGLLCTSMLSTSCSTFFVGVYTEVNLPCVDMLAGVPAHQLICVVWYSRVFIGFFVL